MEPNLFLCSSVNSVSWSSPRFGATLAAGSSDGAITILSRVEAESDWKFVQVPKCHEVSTITWVPGAAYLDIFSFTIKICAFNYYTVGLPNFKLESQ